MTTPSNPQDEKWLAALAGHPEPDADAPVNQQAAALRKALQQRGKQVDAHVPPADDALYQRILFRLRRERLSDDAPIQRSNWGYWGLAATLLLGAVLVLQSGLFDSHDNELAVRGDRHATVMIVTDPQTRASELLTGLKAVGAEPKLERLQPGRMKIVVKSSNAVLDYLSTQHIDPKIHNETVVLILDPAPK